MMRRRNLEEAFLGEDDETDSRPRGAPPPIEPRPENNARSVMAPDFFEIPTNAKQLSMPEVLFFDVGRSQYSFETSTDLGDDLLLPTQRPRNDDACTCIALMFGLYAEHSPFPRSVWAIKQLGREVLAFGYAFYRQMIKDTILHLCMPHMLELFTEHLEDQVIEIGERSMTRVEFFYELMVDVALITSAVMLGSGDEPKYLPLDEIRKRYDPLMDFYQVCQSRLWYDLTPGVSANEGIEKVMPNLYFMSNGRFAEIFKRCNLLIAMHCEDKRHRSVILLRKLHQVVTEIHERLSPETVLQCYAQLNKVYADFIEAAPNLAFAFEYNIITTTLLIEAAEAVFCLEIEYLRQLIKRAINDTFGTSCSAVATFENVYRKLVADSTTNPVASLCLMLTHCMSLSAKIIHGVEEVQSGGRTTATSEALFSMVGGITPPWVLSARADPRYIDEHGKEAMTRLMPTIYGYRPPEKRKFIVRTCAPFSLREMLYIMRREEETYKRTVSCAITVDSKTFCVSTRSGEFFLFDSHRATARGNALLAYSTNQLEFTELLQLYCKLYFKSKVAYSMFMVSDDFPTLSKNLLDAYNSRGNPTGGPSRMI